MNVLDRALARFNEFWSVHGDLVVLAGLGFALVAVAASFIVARRKGRQQRWLATAANFAVLAMSAEGMLLVMLERLGAPLPLALVAFTVTELLLVSQAMAARQCLEAATELAAAGQYEEAEKQRGQASRHLLAVWLIAAVSGLVVATNATTVTEALMRFALPLAAAFMWWTSITPSGARPPRGSWQWTPRRLLIHLGAITADDGDVEQINREHTIQVMTRLARRIHHGLPTDGLLVVATGTTKGRRTGPLSRWRLRRLERLALRADDAMLSEVQERVRRAARAAELTRPDHDRGTGGESVREQHTVNVHRSAADSPALVHKGAAVNAAVNQPVNASVNGAANRAVNGGSGEPVTVNGSVNGSVNKAANGPVNGSAKRSVNAGPTLDECVAKATDAYQPGVEVTNEWVMGLTGCGNTQAWKVRRYLAQHGILPVTFRGSRKAALPS